MKTRCKVCLKFDYKIKAEKIKKGKSKWLGQRFRNLSGKRWEGRMCPSCSLIKQTKIRHQRGGSRFDNPIPIHKKGIESENIIKEYYIGLGYEVSQSTIKGPDLIIKKGKRYLRKVEVKSAVKNSMYNSWHCAPIHELRKNDDLVAIVFDKDMFFIETMTDHLSKCTASGQRGLTYEARCYGLINNNANASSPVIR